MRLQISHETTFTFETPAQYAVQTLRLTPRGSSQQSINDWRINVSADCRLSPVEDPFGNWTHTFSIDGPISQLVITASGEVMTEETSGIIRGTPERLPVNVFLRETDATRFPADLRETVMDIHVDSGHEPLATLHALMGWINEAIGDSAEPSDALLPLARIVAAGRGTARDRAHLFISAARSLDIPARYVNGYVFDPDGPATCSQMHSWAEAWLGGNLGWIGFDPSLNLCPTELHVRVATSLDHLDASPIRATSHGGFGESRTSRISLRERASRRQRAS